MVAADAANGAGRGRAVAYALGLALATAIAFAGALELGTVEYDDPLFVKQNPHTREGVTLEGLRWAATSSYAANWFPLTWASHMLDYEIWGENFAGHHATNVGLHILNTLLLFALLGRMTGRLGCAAIVAGLFALHPVHVESVAWLSERKGVLSAAFALGAANVYVGAFRDSRAVSARRMLGVAGLFAASLASKPMYVTFPFLLLLLDAWPLDRVKWGALRAREFAASGLPRLVAEKWPLFVLTALSCAITISVQTAAIVTMEQFPLLQRIASVPYAYVTYIGMTLWPVGLIPMQLHPGREISVAFGFAMGAVLIAATGAVLARASRAPAVAVGWLWFLGMLLPVIGILQVGSTLVADRYTYLSSVGLFIAATWTFADALARTSAPRWVGPVAGVAVLGLCAVLTRGQVPYWTDTVSLFARTVEVEPANHVAHSHLGNGYELRGEDELALVHHTRAAQLRSYHHMSLFALGERLVREGRFDLATRAFEAELAAKPDAAPARLQLAALRQRQGDGNGARAQLEFARAILPDSAEVLGKMAFLEGSLGDFAAAEQKLREALAVDPGYAEGYGALALLLARRGDFDEARELAARSAELEPTSAQAAELVKHLNQLEAAARAPAGGGS